MKMSFGSCAFKFNSKLCSFVALNAEVFLIARLSLKFKKSSRSGFKIFHLSNVKTAAQTSASFAKFIPKLCNLNLLEQSFLMRRRIPKEFNCIINETSERWLEAERNVAEISSWYQFNIFQEKRRLKLLFAITLFHFNPYSFKLSF